MSFLLNFIKSCSHFFIAKTIITIIMNFTFLYLLPVHNPSSQHVSSYTHTVIRYHTASIVFTQHVSVSLLSFSFYYNYVLFLTLATIHLSLVLSLSAVCIAFTSYA